jgi:hypothetical protein
MGVAMDLVDTIYIISDFISLYIDLDNILETRPDPALAMPELATPQATSGPTPAPEG